MIRDEATQQLSEPSVSKRECMGWFSGDCTAASSVSLQDRHAIVGRAMDRFTTVRLFGLYTILASFSTPQFLWHVTNGVGSPCVLHCVS
jgi:hypothetical protein